MPADESFKRAGSVPFTWEIQPGIPKPFQSSIEPPSPTLKPPPSGTGNYFTGQAMSRLRSKSVRTRSDRNRFDRPSSKEVSTGSPICFPPLMTRKAKKKKGKTEAEEVDYTSDPETLARWSSSSTGKTLASFLDSASSSSSSSSSCFGSPAPFSYVQSSSSSSSQVASDAVGSLRPFWRN